MASSFQSTFSLIVMVFVTSTSIIETKCPPQFEDVCKCGYVPYGPEQMLTYVTNCTNAGFDNTMMLRNMPRETEVLIFVGNEVKDLPVNIFGLDTLYEKLHTIDLSNNHIQTIKGRTFHNVVNVTKLILNDNDLYIIFKDLRPRMFSNFGHLKELHLRNAFTEKVKSEAYLSSLEQIFKNSSLKHLRILDLDGNEICDIEPEEFCSLPALEELHLGNNHLKDIPLISCLKHLKLFDITNNLIPRFSEKSLQNLELIKSNTHLMVNLTDNPFKCDCNMIGTYTWIMRTPMLLPNREKLYCANGYPSNIGKSIVSIRSNELQCIPELQEYSYHYSAMHITLTIGICLILIGVVVLMYKYRESVAKSFRRIIEPIRSKIYYVSLESMDV